MTVPSVAAFSASCSVNLTSAPRPATRAGRVERGPGHDRRGGGDRGGRGHEDRGHE
ncbi:hypothetical protein ACIBEJ_36720 [Nonomuraea sp. NPDC050790]|uniref:hypothetical protein n=1 Tax=Nonomuraea sp. NPDC050790 TaxID=3364371 RepID=UPI00379399D7